VTAIPAVAQGYDHWLGAWWEVPGGGETDANLAAANFNSPYLFMKGINTHIYANNLIYLGVRKRLRLGRLE